MKELQKEFENRGEKQRQKFLRHLYGMLDNPKNEQIITWCEHGFVIQNVDEFKTQLLPTNFKHNNYQSFMRQLNKYGFKIKSKENQKAYFTHPTIREQKRETKRVLTIKKNSQKLDYKNELKILKAQLDDLKEGQRILNKQFQLSIKIMMKLQSHYARLNMMTLHTVGFANIFGNLMYTNHKKIWGNIGGDLFQFQLNSIVQGFPELLDTKLQTPIMSNLGTPLPFINFWLDEGIHKLTSLVKCIYKILDITIILIFLFPYKCKQIQETRIRESPNSFKCYMKFWIIQTRISFNGLIKAFYFQCLNIQNQFVASIFQTQQILKFLKAIKQIWLLNKGKQKDTVKFIHDIINQDKRELKKQQLIKTRKHSEPQRRNCRHEIRINQVAKAIDNPEIINGNLQKLMSYLFKSMTRFINVTASTIDYSKAFSTMLLSNLSKAIPNVSGDLLQHQLGAAKIAFPDFFTSTFVTPTASLFGTPIPFYISMLQELLFLKENYNNK